MPTAMPTTIHCWVFGDNPQSVFEVKVYEHKDITSLKTAIKKARGRALHAVSAPDLELRKVDLSYHDLEEWRPTGPPLLPFQKLAIFNDANPERVNLIVKKPCMSQSSLF
jgi:hypothetical protein